MAQVRWLWPEIAEARKTGHTLKQICEELNQCGLDISYGLFRAYAARMRRKPGAKRPAMPSATLLHRRPEPPPGEDLPPGFDPTANLRERLAKRPGFQFEERPPDESKLI